MSSISTQSGTVIKQNKDTDEGRAFDNLVNKVIDNSKVIVSMAAERNNVSKKVAAAAVNYDDYCDTTKYDPYKEKIYERPHDRSYYPET